MATERYPNEGQPCANWWWRGLALVIGPFLVSPLGGFLCAVFMLGGYTSNLGEYLIFAIFACLVGFFVLVEVPMKLPKRVFIMLAYSTLMGWLVPTAIWVVGFMLLYRR